MLLSLALALAAEPAAASPAASPDGGSPSLDAAAPAASPEAADAVSTEVTVGSYGRVEAATRPDGSGSEAIPVAAHPGRLDEDPYLELDVGWHLQTASGARFRALVTPALSGPLFHSTGAFDASLAVRNLYAEAADVGVRDLGVWAGSRMYRGDDVYLLDFWPLDSQNTVGGGVWYRPGGLELAAHVGLNRLSADDWQVQYLSEATPGGVAAEDVLALDRQRTVASVTAAYAVPIGVLTLRPRLHGQLHTLPAGEREVAFGVEEALPAERGWLAGGELSLYGWGHDSYVNVFYRHATGIAAVGELTVPTDGFALDGSVNAAREDLGALAANVDGGVWSVAAGAYVRGWADADGNVTDPDDGWEWVASVRPGVYPTRYLALQAELAHEAAFPAGLDPRTGAQERPAITRVTLLPGVQLGRGTFARPSIHLRYTLALVNPSALARLDPADVRRLAGPVQHTIGIGAEWWIQSEGYR